MISTQRFLDLLEKGLLLSPSAVDDLRDQVANAPTPVTAEMIAAVLVQHGHLTAPQAQRLLAANERDESSPQITLSVLPPKPTLREEDIGFAPIEEEYDVQPERPKKRQTAASRRPVRETAQPKSPPETSAPEPKPGSLIDDEMPLIESGIDLMSENVVASDALSAPLMRRRRWSLARWFRRRSKSVVGRRRRSMLVGGGSLLLFLFFGFALGWGVWTLTRSGADTLFRMANDDYWAGSYVQAIDQFNTYLKKYPDDPRNSMARVRLGMAQLREAHRTGNGSSAVQTARNVLEQISEEKAFPEVHGELAVVLPEMADRLADEADKNFDQSLVAEAQVAVFLTEQYVPKSICPKRKLQEIANSLSTTLHRITCGNELDKTIAAMHAAAKRSQTEAAYQACNALVRQYPDLADNARLRAAIESVSEAQRSKVKKVTEQRSAAGERENPAIRHQIVLTQSDVKALVPDAANQIAVVSLDGTVYGLDAARGQVLWQRFVGSNSKAATLTPLSNQADADVLAVDAAHHELLRMTRSTGQVRWRHAIGEPIVGHPVPAGDKIVAATSGGKLVTLAADSGRSSDYVQLPQLPGVSPVVDTRHSLIFQVANHTNLYALSLTDGTCQYVAYLGHRQGNITASPVVLDDFLVVGMGDDAHNGVLKVFSIQPNETSRLKPVQEIRMDGRIPTSLLVDGRRLLVTTSSGGARLFELSNDPATPLRKTAETSIEGNEPHSGFSLLHADRFWTADNRLRTYELHSAEGHLVPKSTIHHDSVFLAPPVVMGSAVITVRRRLGMAGAIVSAVSVQDAEKYWETKLASPPAGAPMVLNDGRLLAVTADGGIFRLDLDSRSTIAGNPLISANASRLWQPLRHACLLAAADGHTSVGKGSELVGLFDSMATEPMIDGIGDLPGRLAAAPVVWGANLLLATEPGFIVAVDPHTGQPTVEPFRPTLDSETKPKWIAPAVVDDDRFVIVDTESKTLYLVGRDPASERLTAINKTTLTKPTAGPIVVLDNTVFLCDDEGGLSRLTLPSLTPSISETLGSRVTWGPMPLDDALLIATSGGQLFCYDSKGNRLWQTALAHGPLVGKPLRIGDAYVLASASGVVWKIESATGNTLGTVDLERVLATGPVLDGDRLIVGGDNGVLYETQVP